MSDAIIRVENLGKKYRIRHQQPQRYILMRDVIMYRLKHLFPRRQGGTKAATVEDFWALQDVSFEIKEGEVLGIIGRNGAGKSTLLRILSRITEPTTGRVRVRGRVASLLEVGTGFHPELTGRENIFLNGAILGMTRAETRARFDEIVAFAEIDKFLDTPVKRYSSGMYVRLAFAVAAHLEPEILIVDEVLAVGDAQFQRKCLGKMRDVGRSGRTVILVSHNMAAVQSLCHTAVLLAQGRLVDRGPTEEVLKKYLSAAGRGIRLTGPGDFPGRARNAVAVIQEATLLSEEGTPVTSIPIGARVTIRLTLAPPRKISAPVFGIGIDDCLGARIVSFNSHMNMLLDVPEISGPCLVDCEVPCLPLTPGDYRVKLVIRERETDLDTIEEAMTFSVEATDWYGTGRLPHSSQGMMVCQARWSLNPTAA